MVVVALIGIMSAIAGPNLVVAVDQARADAEILEVEHIIRSARNRARNAVCIMLVTVNANNIQIGPDPLDTNADCVALPTETVALGTHVSIVPFTVSSVAEQPFKFNSDGGTDYGGRGILVVGNSVNARTRTLEVWPAVGTVAVVVP